MKSKFLLKLLLPVLLFVIGNSVFAQTITLTPVVGSMNSVYSATPTTTTLTVSATGLTGATETVTISTPVGYEISLDNITFSSSVNINAVANDITPAQTLYVRIIALSNVGTYAGGNISASSASAATQTQATGSNNITPKPITISAPTIAARVYNGTTAAGVISLGTIFGLVGSETLTVGPTGTAYASANVGSHTSDVSYAIADGSGLASNYSALATTSGVVGGIIPKPITIAAPTIAPKEYDGLSSIGVVTLGAITGLVAGETLNVTTSSSGYSSNNVGAYTANVIYTVADGGGGGLASNYSNLAISLAVPGSIIPKPITISAPTIAPKVYDATTTAGVITIGTVSGTVGAQTLTVTPSATAYSSANVGAAYTSTVSYVIADGSGLATNYSALAPNNLTGLSITPKTITISAPIIAPKVYNGTTAAGVITPGTVVGTIGGQTLTVTPSATAYSSANVGAAYTSTVSYVVTDGTGLAANYSTLAPNNLVALSITPAPLTITANGVSKYHGDVLASPVVGSTAFSSTGLVAPETIGSVTITYGPGALAPAPLGANVGHVVASAATGGTFTATNYTITYAPGTLTVIPNTNAYLSNLVSSTGALNTAFNRNDIDYETYVLIAVNSLTVTPTTENQFATVQVRINNTGFSPEPYAPVLSGAASPVMTLQEGDNMIDITVTAEDGVTVINYRIKVSREASWVSGGGGGGLESRSLGDAIAKRIFNKAINSENGPVDYTKLPQVQFRDIQNRVQGTTPSSVSLTSIMPDITSKGYVAYNSSPKDLTSITNAKEVLAFDFTSNKEVKAVAFATKTLGELYDHTKPICDRLKGATLLGVETIKVQGFEFIKYSIKNENGQKEYATSFTVGTRSGRPDFSLQSIYLTQDYANDETMYNFQLWAGSTSLVTDMVADILTKLKAVAPVNVIKSSALPTTYVESGKREGQNVNLVVKNATPNTSGYFKLEDKATETSSSSVVRNIPFTINANGKTNVIIPMDDKYESTLTMYVGGEVKDVVYMSDGTWAVDYNKATTVLSSFNVVNDSKRAYSAEEYPLFRNVELKANSSDFVSVVKLLRGGGAAADLTAFKGLKFAASGGYNLHVTLVKNGITNYNDQYATDVQLELGQQDYYIALDKFKSASTSASIDAKDITSIIFTVEVGTGRNSPITTTIANVAFTKEDLNYLNSLDAKAVSVYPNPVTGNRITVNFSSAKAAELSLRVTDMNGKVLTLKQVQAVKGMNTVQVPVSNGLTGVHLISLDGSDIKYKTTKVMIAN
ncbi:MAG: hypothetical protein CFE25_14280 [Chitinophagaceae bacterium BSSC1]|nr:MAG: hypothetical protein CFE25_14280 [Chitinophagaceae bacterium BSSC1]